ncbi:Polyferredoxin NapH (periplasmic nitrate reductase) [uncultured Candidatus Thioglobus sp.]|nr:Polyferredoxin NapH (periplasmic nitrate reductase) [uncultured Candidatus Thioglobus sp.]
MKKINICQVVGDDAKKTKGWIGANKYLVLRRLSQLGILFLFLLGPWFDIWIIKGNLTSSLTLDVLPLSNPFVLLQSFFAGHSMATDALIGVSIVLVFYLIVGGRVFCSWVCPVNVITDTASYFRCKLNIKVTSTGASNKTRYWLLVMSMLIAWITGSIVWELVNPVSILHRGIIFGMSIGWGPNSADIFI